MTNFYKAIKIGPFLDNAPLCQGSDCFLRGANIKKKMNSLVNQYSLKSLK